MKEEGKVSNIFHHLLLYSIDGVNDFDDNDDMLMGIRILCCIDASSRI